MPSQPVEHTGARIRWRRKDRHLTQRELAARAQVAMSTLTKVEQGRLAASPAVVGRVAKALSVPVSELTGQPYMEDLRRDQLDGLIQPIRASLNLYDLGEEGIALRPLPELHQEAEELCALVRETRIKQAASRLPSLVAEVTSAAHQDGSSAHWKTLASVYRTAYDVTSKLGFADLCTVALDRMEWAAERASDPVLSALRQYMRALAYLRVADYRTGERLVASGMNRLAQAEDSRPAQVATGQLHLGAAVLAARDGSRSAAEEHLGEAERIARGTGPAEKVHWLSFGPVNVGVHRVSVLSELDEHGHAVQAARELEIPRWWPASRAAHHWGEVARAQMWDGKPKRAFRSLVKARQLAPQQTKYSPMVRETAVMLEHSQRQIDGTLSNYLAYLGS